MGFLSPAPVPAPPPPPPAPPPPPTIANASTQAAGAAAGASAAAAGGAYGGTLLTSGQGVPAPATATKELLGQSILLAMIFGKVIFAACHSHGLI